MIVNLYNERITNDKPLYHDTLEPEFGVKIEKVKYVDTVSRKCIIAVDYPTEDSLSKALNLLSDWDVEVNSVDDNFHPKGKSLQDSFSAIPDIAKRFNGHTRDVKVDENLNIIYHLAISPTFLLKGHPQDSDQPFLNSLSGKSIFLNHWDTNIEDGKRWSIVLPWGENISDFRATAFGYGLSCEMAWKNDALWRETVDNLFNKAEQKVNPYQFGGNFHDLQDAFQTTLLELEVLLMKTWSKSLKNECIDQKSLAGALGNFYSTIKRRIIDKRRRQKNISLVDEYRDVRMSEDVAELIVSNERKMRLEDFLSNWLTKLSDREKLILKMKVEGSSSQQIAKSISGNPGAVRTMASRTIPKLKKELRESGLINEPWVRDQLIDALYKVL